MKARQLLFQMVWFWGWLAAGGAAYAQGTAFTYQGQLQSNGSPVSGTYDLTFTLYNTNNGGTSVAAVTNAGVVVSGGLFTVTNDFGTAPFTGAPLWLQIGVGTNIAGPFSPLLPRQQLTAAPYAITAGSASNLLGSLPASQLSGTVPLARLPSAVVTNGGLYVSKTGDVLTGNLSFNAPSNAGLVLNSLTSAQRTNLSATNGMLVYDTTLNQTMAYQNGVWTNAAASGGQALLASPNLFTGTSNTFQGTLALQTNAAQPSAALVLPQGVAGAPNSGLWLGDYNYLHLSSDGTSGYAYWNPAHSGSPEWQVNATRIALLVGRYAADGYGAMQFGSSSFGTNSHGAVPRWYFNASKYPNTVGDALGYSQWLDFRSPIFNGTGLVDQNVGFRGEAKDTNGTSAIVFYAPTYGGLSTGNNGPAFNENPGVKSLEIWASTNSIGTRVVMHGGETHDLVDSAPASTNYGLNFETAPRAEIELSANLNVTNVPPAFPRTNQYDSKTLYIYPGGGTYSATWPANWIWMSTTSGATVAPTNLAANTVLRVEVERLIGNSTNYFASATYGTYTSVIDASAGNFFNATAGALSTAESNAVNTFVMNAKNKGYWQNLLAFYPMVGGTSNSCKWNLVNTNLYPITWHAQSATNFTATGVYGDGIAFYGDTGLLPSTQVSSQNSSADFGWVRGPAVPTDASYFMGVADFSPHQWGFGRQGSNARDAGMNNGAVGEFSYAAAGNFTGVCGQNRIGATTQQDYLNGLPVGGTTFSATTGLPAQSLYLFARDDGGPADSFANVNLNGACVGQNMTSQNCLDLISDWTALNNALGR